MIYCLREELAYAFTTDKVLANVIISAMPLLVILTIGDYIQGIAQGTIRAMGYQHYASIVSLFCYWVVSLSLTYILAFVYNYGIRGIWGGMPLALLLSSLSFLYLIYSTDFEKLSVEIVDRIHKEGEGKYLLLNL